MTTNGAGMYSARFLQPDTTKWCLRGGLSKVDRKNLQLTVGQDLTVDARLPTARIDRGDGDQRDADPRYREDRSLADL